MKGFVVLVAMTVCGVLIPSAEAEIRQFVFPLDAAQEVQNPAVVSPATGLGTVILNTDLAANNLTWNVSFEGLLGNVIGAHFHGPAAAGSNASILVNIGPISGLASPLIGAATITDLQEAQVLAGLWYVNIHTSQFGSGEIRGQVVPEPGALALMGLVAVGCLLKNQSDRRRRESWFPRATRESSHS